ncbi:MAG TPA: hypothetical protein VM534_07895, partial [Thermoanaerobaculia bacterium]|nr:hypothetical protein [Thermoanaerobaculia bacterium]
FFAHEKLRKIDIAGGPPVTIAEALHGRGGSWSKTGVIVFEPHWRDPLFKVPASGGKVEPVTRLDEEKVETTHRYPWFLPDGKHFLFLAAVHKSESDSELNAIYVGSIDSPERKLILQSRSNAVYASGHLLFIREKYLMAQPFDLRALELTGTPFRIAEDIAYSSGFFRGIFGASENGVLAYVRGSAESQSRLVRFDREGKELGPIGEPDEIGRLRFSPDGARIAVETGDPADLWIIDVARGTRSRFTSERMQEANAVWSPDGSRIVFSSDRNVVSDLFEKTVGTTTREQPLLITPDNLYPSDWSRDGRFLIFDRVAARSGARADIWALPMEREGKPFPLVEGDSDDWGGMVSPDGRWLAFTSDDSGRYEIYVIPFPGPGPRRQISTGGGLAPFWRADGQELLYSRADNALMSIEVSGDQFSNPATLHHMPKEIRVSGGDLAPDAQSYILAVQIPPPANISITLVKEWTAAHGSAD